MIVLSEATEDPTRSWFSTPGEAGHPKKETDKTCTGQSGKRRQNRKRTAKRTPRYVYKLRQTPCWKARPAARPQKRKQSSALWEKTGRLPTAGSPTVFMNGRCGRKSTYVPPVCVLTHHPFLKRKDSIHAAKNGSRYRDKRFNKHPSTDKALSTALWLLKGRRGQIWEEKTIYVRRLLEGNACGCLDIVSLAHWCPSDGSGCRKSQSCVFTSGVAVNATSRVAEYRQMPCQSWKGDPLTLLRLMLVVRQEQWLVVVQTVVGTRLILRWYLPWRMCCHPSYYH